MFVPRLVGAEAPYLKHVLGASRLVCVRAPEADLPADETVSVAPPNGPTASNVRILSLDVETDLLPIDVADADLVIMLEVLEHLCRDPMFAIWQAIVALRVGGILCLTKLNAVWHVYTIAQLCGYKALGLKLQREISFATHRRL